MFDLFFHNCSKVPHAQGDQIPMNKERLLPGFVGSVDRTLRVYEIHFQFGGEVIPDGWWPPNSCSFIRNLLQHRIHADQFNDHRDSGNEGRKSAAELVHCRERLNGSEQDRLSVCRVGYVWFSELHEQTYSVS